MKRKDLVIVGTGPMAAAHAEALNKIGITPNIVGRRPESAEMFSTQYGLAVVSSNLGDYLKHNRRPSHAIIAVPIPALETVAQTLIDYGVTEILLEKPGALNVSSLLQMSNFARQKSVNVWIAYNRRFLDSTDYVLSTLAGGNRLLSIECEFNERIDELQELGHSPEVLARWLIANSSHVLDLAIFLGGFPKLLFNKPTGRLDWHESAATFNATGTTPSGATVAFRADWRNIGNWRLKLETSETGLQMGPLEEVYRLSSTSGVPELLFAPRPSFSLKPGFLRQALEFVSTERTRLCSLGDQIKNMGLYEQIGGYVD